MSDDRTRRRQRSVLYLEPKRTAATISASFGTLIFAAVCAAVLLYLKSQQGQTLGGIPQPALAIVAGVAGCLGLLCLTLAIINGRRWHLGRAVERLSSDPLLASYLPDGQMLPARRPADVIPVLHIDDRKPREIPGPPFLGPVTAASNVVGERPLKIVYLRVFENGPRTSTFIKGAWREFGYVYLLRSAKSVTPSEFRRAAPDLSGLFISSERQFDAVLDRSSAGPNPWHRHRFRNICPYTIKVRDRYGSYPVRAFLCHGEIWQYAVRKLLDLADLVVLDLSGFMPDSLGVRYELQLVVDRFRIERVIFLADERSDLAFLRAQVRQAWARMAVGSPNSGPRPRVARIAVTDVFQRQTQHRQLGPGGPQGQQAHITVVQTRLAARRSESRRLAAGAPAAAQHRPRPSREPPPAPRIRPAPHGPIGG
jgi:hypothetical protein